MVFDFVFVFLIEGVAYSGKIDHRVPPRLPLSLFHRWLHLEVPCVGSQFTTFLALLSLRKTWSSSLVSMCLTKILAYEHMGWITKGRQNGGR